MVALITVPSIVQNKAVLVIVPRKNVGFGYFVQHMPYKIMSQKPKKHRKHTKQNWRKSLGTAFLPRLCVFCFFDFLRFGFLRVFLFFFSALYPMNASESKNPKKSRREPKNKEQKRNKQKHNPLDEILGQNISCKTLVFAGSFDFFLRVFFQPCSR